MIKTARVEDLARAPVVSCGPDIPLREVARSMSEAHCSSIVVMEDGRPLGIWTERDALSVDFSSPDTLNRPIRNFMNAPVKTIPAGTPVGEAVLRFGMEQVRRFLVVDGLGIPLGVLTQSDVVRSQGIDFLFRQRSVLSALRGQSLILPGELSLGEAARRMRVERRDAVVVAVEGGLGILTERDMVRLLGWGQIASTLQEVASFPLLAVGGDTNLFQARFVFEEKRVRHLGVLDGEGGFAGLLGFSDLLACIEYDYVRELQSLLGTQAEEIREARVSLMLAEKVSETSGEGVMVTSPAGVIESVNPAFSAMTGYAWEELVGRTPALLRSGRHGDEFYRELWRSLHERGVWVGEVWDRRQDGRVVPFHVRISALRNEAGALIHFVAAYSDLSWQKQADQAKEESDRRFKTLIEVLPDAVFFKDGEGRWLIVNAPARELFELEGVPWRGKTDWELSLLQPHLGEAYKACAASDDAAWQKGEPVRGVETITDNEGSVRYYAVTKIPLFNGDGSRNALVVIGRDNTDERWAETALRRERDFADAIFNTAGSIITVLDRKGRVVRFNRTAERITGYSFEDLEGLPFWETFLPPEEHERVGAVFDKIIAGNVVSHFENAWIMRDGSRRMFAWSNSVLLGDDGQVEYLIANGIDISERKKAEEALRESEERYRLTIAAVNDGIWDWDLASNRIIWNDRVFEMLDYPAGAFEPTLMAWGELVHPEDRAETMTAVRSQLSAAGKAFSIEYRVRRADGDWLWVESRGRVVAWREGVPARVVGTHTDISGRKAAELALRESEAYNKLLFERSRVPMVVMEPDGIRIVDCNAAAVRAYGLRSREELLGRTPLEFSSPRQYQGEDSAEALKNHIARALAEGGAHLWEWHYRRLNGEPWDAEVHVMTFRHGDRMLIQFSLQDITERKRSEEALRRLNTTLERRVQEEVTRNLEQERLLIQQARLAAMGEMIGNIAHQWRQPINALGILLTNIQDAYDFGELSPEVMAGEVENGYRLIQRMSATIDDFRNFFRPNKEKTRFSLNRAVADTLSILGASLRNNGIQVQVAAGGEIYAWGYENEYAQVLLNLVNNAKDAIAGRSDGGTIEIAIKQNDGAALVTVRDDGGGIPESILSRVFDPYFTTKEKGTGIGLYMSKVIIEHNMGGGIEARNVAGGAEFTVSCPASVME